MSKIITLHFDLYVLILKDVQDILNEESIEKPGNTIPFLDFLEGIDYTYICTEIENLWKDIHYKKL